jgi:hypothetical protein
MQPTSGKVHPSLGRSDGKFVSLIRLVPHPSTGPGYETGLTYMTLVNLYFIALGKIDHSRLGETRVDLTLRVSGADFVLRFNK